jgi:hypothetical protein
VLKGWWQGTTGTSMIKHNRYWDQSGKYQAAVDLLRARIPLMGSVESPKKNPKLERFRKAVNCYYDLYNNGLGNRAREFAKVFFASSRYKTYEHGRYLDSMYTRVELCMDQIVEAAAHEQGIELVTKASNNAEVV